ncbi:MAG TPA: amidase family protein, partial [Thermomicrobiales bacterium]|nr:amidase family protein [Thermomicrobiales bacterium]
MPVTETELHYLSAVEALALFRARKLSPVELMAAVIARAEAVEPTVNAFTHRFFDAAMESARVAEARYAGRGPRPRPLEGIPLAVKEEMSVAGHPNSSASLIFKDDVADHTSPLN